MRLLVVMALALVVVLHHGTPMLGHAAHAQAAGPCGAGDCAPHGGGMHGSPVPGNPAHGGDDGTSDMGMAAVCMAILAMAGAVLAGLGRRLRALPVPGAPRAPISRWRVAPGPPAHGPPRPLRPCVLQQ